MALLIFLSALVAAVVSLHGMPRAVAVSLLVVAIVAVAAVNSF